MAKDDYLPRREGDLLNWLQNFTAKIDEHGKNLGLTQPEMDELKAQAQALIAEIEKLEQIKADMHQQTAIKNDVKKNSIALIRSSVQRMKTDPGYTEAAGQDLDIIGPDSGFDPDTYRPEISADTFPGYVRISFSKMGVDGVNIYSRPAGATHWTFIARDHHSPYNDSRPLAQPDTPETREYAARGVTGDEEIGLLSDVVSAVFAG